jgi:serine/threonine protein phosphatase PrpC
VGYLYLHAGLTDTGRVRPGNEDAWACDPAQGLYIVADGMGGHNAGEVAAALVVESLPTLVRTRIAGGRRPPGPAALVRRLRSAVSRLSRDVFARALADPRLHGMGATVVLALVRDDVAIIVHLGDSRAYLLRAGDLRPLTRDHSVVQDLLDSGRISPAEVATHPARNRITAGVGMPGAAAPGTRRVPLDVGDKLLLCSDGLAGVISDEAIGEILGRATSPERICQNLIDAANAAGGIDNITAVVIQVCEREIATTA